MGIPLAGQSWLLVDLLSTFWEVISSHFTFPIPPEDQYVVGFIDSTETATCRIGRIRNSNISPDLIQRAFYSGYKRVHGLKHQAFDCPFGMTMDLWGPITVRRNDCHVLRMSRLRNRLEDLEATTGVPYKVYADSIYPLTRHIRRRNGHEALDLEFARIRTSIEWDYGQTKNLFHFIDYKKNLKLQNPITSLVYFVATILRNCYVCMNGSETSYYFSLTPPSLENYLAAGPRI